MFSFLGNPSGDSDVDVADDDDEHPWLNPISAFNSFLFSCNNGETSKGKREILIISFFFCLPPPETWRRTRVNQTTSKGIPHAKTRTHTHKRAKKNINKITRAQWLQMCAPSSKSFGCHQQTSARGSVSVFPFFFSFFFSTWVDDDCVSKGHQSYNTERQIRIESGCLEPPSFLFYFPPSVGCKVKKKGKKVHSCNIWSTLSAVCLLG